MAQELDTDIHLHNILQMRLSLILTLVFPLQIYTHPSFIQPDRIQSAPLHQVHSPEHNAWKEQAIRHLWEERKRMGHTPLVRIPIPGFPRLALYMKNETATPTQTLKHRFAWALFMWMVTDGKVSMASPLYDSTSGNTGSAEAYMAALVGLNYTAVVAKDLEKEKVDQIERFGGKIHKVDVSLRNYWADKLATDNRGFYINQFGNADAAEEYHESGNYSLESVNVYHEILTQLGRPPDYFVHSAGTGGTITSVGRYVARYGKKTRVVLADSQFSVYMDYVNENKYTKESAKNVWKKPGVAGIGYGYDVEPVIYKQTTSLLPSVIAETVRMPDAASVGAVRWLHEKGVNGGPSTALNFLVSLYKAVTEKGKDTTVVTLLADPGSFYLSTYLNDTWVDTTMAYLGGTRTVHCWQDVITRSINNGTDFYAEGTKTCST